MCVKSVICAKLYINFYRENLHSSKKISLHAKYLSTWNLLECHNGFSCRSNIAWCECANRGTRSTGARHGGAILATEAAVTVVVIDVDLVSVDLSFFVYLVYVTEKERHTRLRVIVVPSLRTLWCWLFVRATLSRSKNQSELSYPCVSFFKPKLCMETSLICPCSRPLLPFLQGNECVRNIISHTEIFPEETILFVNSLIFTRVKKSSENHKRIRSIRQKTKFLSNDSDLLMYWW